MAGYSYMAEFWALSSHQFVDSLEKPPPTGAIQTNTTAIVALGLFLPKVIYCASVYDVLKFLLHRAHSSLAPPRIE